MSKCEYLGDNGICSKLSDSEAKQPCVEGPCEHDTAVSELNKLEQAKATLKHLCKNAPSILYAEDLYLIESLIDEKIKNARTASPRFTSSEIQAIKAVLKMAEQSENVPFKEIHLSRVRFMLEEEKQMCDYDEEAGFGLSHYEAIQNNIKEEPRFTTGEREAMKELRKCAGIVRRELMPNGHYCNTRNKREWARKIESAIATVRKMLEGAE